MRVLAVASAGFAGGAWPATPHGFDFRLLGLVALANPLRDTVPRAVEDCRRAGIRVLMITGDHPGPRARSRARPGSTARPAYLLGDEVAALDDAALRHAVRTTTVFARVPRGRSCASWRGA